MLRFYVFDWPVVPSWLYRLNQGLHVTIGVALVPIVLGKLWSVLPKLFQWPPLRSPAEALERISLLALVGGILFELVTGLLNIQNDYVFGFSFYTAHFYGAIVFIAGFVTHVSLKVRLATRSVRGRENGADGPDELASARAGSDDHQPPRRGRSGRRHVTDHRHAVRRSDHRRTAATPGAALAPRRARQPFLPDQPHRQDGGGATRRRRLRAGTRRCHARVQPDAWRSYGPCAQVTASLPIACVEGWSSLRNWTGVPLRDLGRLVGMTEPVGAYVESLEKRGAYRHVSLSRRQVGAAHTLLALRVDGHELSLDHGYPARMIIPAAPGVHCTKWVSKVTFDV